MGLAIFEVSLVVLTIALSLQPYIYQRLREGRAVFEDTVKHFQDAFDRPSQVPQMIWSEVHQALRLFDAIYDHRETNGVVALYRRTRHGELRGNSQASLPGKVLDTIINFVERSPLWIVVAMYTLYGVAYWSNCFPVEERFHTINMMSKYQVMNGVGFFLTLIILLSHAIWYRRLYLLSQIIYEEASVLRTETANLQAILGGTPKSRADAGPAK